MEAFGAIRSSLEPFDAIWGDLAQFGVIRSHLEPFEWRTLEPAVASLNQLKQVVASWSQLDTVEAS